MVFENIFKKKDFLFKIKKFGFFKSLKNLNILKF